MVCGSVYVFIFLSVMVVRIEDKSGNCSGLSGHGCLDLNGANLCVRTNSKVPRALFKVLTIVSRDSYG